MNWFRKHRPDPIGHEGAVAKKRTEEDGKKADVMGVEVQRLAKSIRELREQNHFAESIANLLKGHK